MNADLYARHKNEFGDIYQGRPEFKAPVLRASNSRRQRYLRNSSMKLPASISPYPIVEAVVEVRFETPVPEDAIFGLVYQALKVDFPKSETLPVASLPPELRKSDQNLALQPLHRLDGQNLTVLVGSQAVAVGVRDGYPGWALVSKRLNATFARIASTGLIGKPLRFGLRYINFFQGDIFPKLTRAPSNTVVQPRYTSASSAWTNSTEAFYTQAPAPLDEAAQLSALESFAERLLAGVVETPQAAVDLLNERFWDSI